MADELPAKYPAAGPVVGPLLELLDLLESSDGPWVASCECGWRSQDWDNEADASADAWAHLPCFRPKPITTEEPA